MKTAAVYWTCLHCTLIGDRDSTAEKHTKTTGHTTMTGTDPGTLARLRELVAS